MGIRINGLLRVTKEIREDLRRGVPPDERDEFMEKLRLVLFRVEEILDAYGVTEADLPRPSRNAVRFLRGIEPGDVPEPRPGEKAPSRAVLVSGIVSVGNRIADRLWEERAELETRGSFRDSLQREIAGHTDAIEEICGDQGGDPSGLSVRSRRVYCWLRFLADGENVLRHVSAIRRAERAVPPEDEGAVRIDLVNTSALTRTRRGRTLTRVYCSEGFVDAGPELWTSVMRLALDRNGTDRRRVREYTDSEEFAEVMIDLEARAAPKGSETGVHHDLGAAFERVNAAYFGGRQSRPTIHWNSAPTVRKLGHYVPSRDTVMLSVVLDAPDVPRHVVEFILYHELLHRELGAERQGGRFVVHSKRFRQEERRFERYAEAVAFLGGLVRRLRG